MLHITFIKSPREIWHRGQDPLWSKYYHLAVVAGLDVSEYKEMDKWFSQFGAQPDLDRLECHAPSPTDIVAAKTYEEGGHPTQHLMCSNSGYLATRASRDIYKSASHAAPPRTQKVPASSRSRALKSPFCCIDQKRIEEFALTQRCLCLTFSPSGSQKPPASPHEITFD
ncbi:hypothetical protein C8R44DRAFT_990403 [Mycena epipterygia]|nr:hypothetical protein C8R44DRAFT_990403 [Mycena epipterygia]